MREHYQKGGSGELSLRSHLLTIYDNEEDQESRSEIEELIIDEMNDSYPHHLVNPQKISSNQNG